MTFKEKLYVWAAAIAAALVGGTVIYEVAKPSSSGGWTVASGPPWPAWRWTSSMTPSAATDIQGKGSLMPKMTNFLIAHVAACSE